MALFSGFKRADSAGPARRDVSAASRFGGRANISGSTAGSGFRRPSLRSADARKPAGSATKGSASYKSRVDSLFRSTYSKKEADARRQGFTYALDPRTGRPTGYFKIGEEPGAGAGGGAAAPGGTASSNRYAALIAQKNKEAEAKAEAQRTEAKSKIDAAYEESLMTPEERKALEGSLFEGGRAQYGHEARRLTEGLYGAVNTGAAKGRVADLRSEEAGAITDIGRKVTMEEGRRKGVAATTRAAGYQRLREGTQYPRYNVPDTFDYGDAATAVGGPAPVRDAVPKATKPRYPGGIIL